MPEGRGPHVSKKDAKQSQQKWGGTRAMNKAAIMDGRAQRNEAAGNIAKASRQSAKAQEYASRTPDPMDLEAQVARKVQNTMGGAKQTVKQVGASATPRTLPMKPMPKRPKTPGMTRRNRGPF